VLNGDGGSTARATAASAGRTYARAPRRGMSRAGPGAAGACGGADSGQAVSGGPHESCSAASRAAVTGLGLGARRWVAMLPTCAPACAARHTAVPNRPSEHHTT